MKVEIKTVRDCCHADDLKPVDGSPRFQRLAPKVKFCVHCGRHWEADSYTDAVQYGTDAIVERRRHD